MSPERSEGPPASAGGSFAAFAAPDLELLFLTMFAAVPLYATQVISPAPLIAFHLAMIGIAIRVAMGKSPELIPLPVMRGIGIASIVFYLIDVAVISRSAIAASTHLVLFISAYQPMESTERRNEGLRLLTASLLFVASVATATHITIVPFVIAFTFLLFRRFMHLSFRETAALAATAAAEPRSTRAAAFYVAGTTAIGILLFPMLPRVRNPIVPGVMASLSSASTGLSDSINFDEQRTVSPDATVVSRVWMGQEAIAFFTPLRLRGIIYERYRNNEWLQGRRDFVTLDTRDGVTRIARPSGFTRRATVQQRFIIGGRLFLPVGTYEVIGVPQVVEYPTPDIYTAWQQTRRDGIGYDVRMAWSTAPERIHPVAVTNYPVTPPVAAMARQLVGNETDPMKQASKIESYMSTHFQYVPDPATLGKKMTVDDFLLRTRRGHCEYFAAGMVALMTALEVPARIVGGFYGGKLNPLTGYFSVRREDAHAWVEVYDGNAWRTFDPTPASLRPGTAGSGLLRAYAAALSDSMNFLWDRYILTFGLLDQVALAADLIAGTRRAFVSANHSARLAASKIFNRRGLVLAAVAAAIVLLAMALAHRRRPAFELLRDHLRTRGIEVGLSMTMEEALERLDRDTATVLQPLITLYEEERFSPHGVAARQIIRRRLAELSRT